MKSILFLFLLLNLSLFAQENKYEGLNEYIISDETTFTIINSKNTQIERKYKALILNRFAEDLNSIALYYNRYTRIAFLKVSVYNAQNKLVKKYTLKDCKDIIQDYQSLASDSRIKYLDIAYNNYPYTVEVEYKIENKESMFYPVWQPFSDKKQAIEKSIFTVIDKQNTGLRYKGHHVDEPQIEKEGESIKYIWKVENTKTKEIEPFSGNYQDVMPIVYLAAKDFEIEGFKGNMETWNNYAAWYYELCKSKADLKEEDLKEIRKICKGLENTREKVKAVYNYVQKNSRYVSVQLGIGGWQPFPASFVHKNKYGDCKALSFYTHCLLEALDIPSYYTLILAGKYISDIPEDFPVSMFNHAILTVPLENDTIWLECTSQTNPFGYMGTFTSDRNCLIITEKGGY